MNRSTAKPYRVSVHCHEQANRGPVTAFVVQAGQEAAKSELYVILILLQLITESVEGRAV